MGSHRFKRGKQKAKWEEVMQAWEDYKAVLKEVHGFVPDDPEHSLIVWLVMHSGFIKK